MCQSAAGSFSLNDICHLSSNGSDLRRRCVSGLLDLIRASLCESDGEEADKIIIGGLDSNIGLDKRLPLANERSQLVGSEVQSMEVGQAVLALDLVHTKANFSERVVLILLEVGERNLNDTTFQSIIRILETCCPVDKGLAHTTVVVSRLFKDPFRFSHRITHSRTLNGFGACPKKDR